MRVTRYKRQVFLFLAAILVPAAVLVGLASRILYQDRGLAAKRAADQRRIAVDQLRRELDGHLEAIKLQEINRLIRSLHVEAEEISHEADDLRRCRAVCRRNGECRFGRCGSSRGGVLTEARSIWLGFGCFRALFVPA
jgi:hypothetical protein